MTDSPPHTPPRRSRLLILLLALLVLHQFGAVIHAINIPPDAAENLSLPPPIQAIVGSFWALIFAWAIIALYRRKSGSVNRALWLIGGFIGYSLIRLLVFTQADYDRQRLPFLLALLVICTFLLASARLIWVRLRDAIKPRSREADIYDR